MLIGEIILLMLAIVLAIVGIIILHGFMIFGWIVTEMMIIDRSIDWALVMVVFAVTILLLAFWLGVLGI